MRLAAAILLLSLPLTAQTHRSLSTGGAPATWNVTSFDPDNSPRWELRVHGLNGATASERLLVDLWVGAWSQFKIYIPANETRVRIGTVADAAPTGFAQPSFGAATDIRIRAQRDLAKGEIQVEIWNGDCSGYQVQRVSGAQNTSAYTGPMRLMAGMAYGFVRAHSTLDFSGSCPKDAPDAIADVVDFTFEADSLASRSNGYTLTTAADRAFSNSPPYSPIATVVTSDGEAPFLKVGQPRTLSGTPSVVFVGNGAPASYTWSMVSGPSGGSLNMSGATTDTLTVNPNMAGPYRVRLSITDSLGGSAYKDFDLGAQVVDSSGVVRLSGALKTAMGGDLIFPGHEQWSWFKHTQLKALAALIPRWTTTYTPVPFAYTCTTSQTEGSPLWTCPGADLLTDFGVGVDGGRFAWIMWDKDGNGTYTGRAMQYLTIKSATTFKQSDYYWTRPSSTAKIALYDSNAQMWFGFPSTAEPNNSWDYYGAGLGLARMCAATNYQPYCDALQVVATNIIEQVIDYGTQSPKPRNNGIMTLIAAAELLGRPVYYQYIKAYMDRNLSPTSAIPYTPGADWRESAFKDRPKAILARIDPDASRRSTYCTEITRAWNYRWKIGKQNGVFWPDDLLNLNPGFPAKDVNGVYGTAPWRTTGLGTLALIEMYQAFADPSACNNLTVAAEILTDIQGAASYLRDKGKHPSRGIFYNVDYETAQDALPRSSMTLYRLLVTQGSPTIQKTIGDQRNWATEWAPCDGTTYIGIYTASPTYRRTYKVVGCTANSLTLDIPYPNPTEQVLGGSHGAMTLTNGSAVVQRGASNSDNWATKYAPCDGSTTITIKSSNPSYSGIYAVTACTTSSVTLTAPWGGPSEPVSYFDPAWGSRTVRANTNCGPYSSATYCEPDYPDINPRDLSGDAVGIFGWLCGKFGNSPAAWCDTAKDWGGAAYGGPAGGYGTTGACHGPYCDGQTSGFGCAIGDATNINCGMGKGYGMHAGVGNVQIGMAYLATFDGGGEPPPTPPRRRAPSGRPVPSGAVR